MSAIRPRRQAAWKPSARLAPKPKPSDVWCPSGLKGLDLPRPDWASSAARARARRQNRFYVDDDGLRENAKIQQKYVRCPDCNRRLQPKYIPNSGSFWEFGGWRLPRHKAKP